MGDEHAPRSAVLDERRAHGVGAPLT
jgi:hypothetical protein